jgi:hypothetical protein
VVTNCAKARLGLAAENPVRTGQPRLFILRTQHHAEVQMPAKSPKVKSRAETVAKRSSDTTSLGK